MYNLIIPMQIYAILIKESNPILQKVDQSLLRSFNRILMTVITLLYGPFNTIDQWIGAETKSYSQWVPTPPLKRDRFQHNMGHISWIHL
jgi:hypothetical protein